FEVYHGASAARQRPKGWVDRASENSLLPYILTYDTLAELLHDSDPAKASQALALARATLANTDYPFDLTPPRAARPTAPGARCSRSPNPTRHDRRNDRDAAGTAALPLGPLRLSRHPRRVRGDAGADDPVLGYLGIHRRRQGARHPASARQSAVHDAGPYVGDDPARGRVRDAHQPVR